MRSSHQINHNLRWRIPQKLPMHNAQNIRLAQNLEPSPAHLSEDIRDINIRKDYDHIARPHLPRTQTNIVRVDKERGVELQPSDDSRSNCKAVGGLGFSLFEREELVSVLLLFLSQKGMAFVLEGVSGCKLKSHQSSFPRRI